MSSGHIAELGIFAIVSRRALLSARERSAVSPLLTDFSEAAESISDGNDTLLLACGFCKSSMKEIIWDRVAVRQEA